MRAATVPSPDLDQVVLLLAVYNSVRKYNSHARTIYARQWAREG